MKKNTPKPKIPHGPKASNQLIKNVEIKKCLTKYNSTTKIELNQKEEKS